MNTPTNNSKRQRYGTITFNDKFAAALYDRRSFDKPLNRQFKDLHTAGIILDRLYRFSAGGDDQAKSILRELALHVTTKQDELDNHIASIEKIHRQSPLEEQLPMRAGAALSFDVLWNNKMYLTLVQMLRDYDSAVSNLIALKDHKTVTHKVYAKLNKRLTSPIRSCLEKIFADSKGVGNSTVDE